VHPGTFQGNAEGNWLLLRFIGFFAFFCSDEMLNTSDDENGSLVQLHGFNIDDKLEEKLKKHGLNRRNAKTIIHVST